MSNVMCDPAQYLTFEYEKSSFNADTMPTLGSEFMSNADRKTYDALSCLSADTVCI